MNTSVVPQSSGEIKLNEVESIREKKFINGMFKLNNYLVVMAAVVLLMDSIYVIVTKFGGGVVWPQSTALFVYGPPNMYYLHARKLNISNAIEVAGDGHTTKNGMAMHIANALAVATGIEIPAFDYSGYVGKPNSDSITEGSYFDLLTRNASGGITPNGTKGFGTVPDIELKNTLDGFNSGIFSKGVVKDSTVGVVVQSPYSVEGTFLDDTNYAHYGVYSMFTYEADTKNRITKLFLATVLKHSGKDYPEIKSSLQSENGHAAVLNVVRHMESTVYIEECKKVVQLNGCTGEHKLKECIWPYDKSIMELVVPTMETYLFHCLGTKKYYAMGAAKSVTLALTSVEVTNRYYTAVDPILTPGGKYRTSIAILLSSRISDTWGYDYFIVDLQLMVMLTYISYLAFATKFTIADSISLMSRVGSFIPITLQFIAAAFFKTSYLEVSLFYKDAIPGFAAIRAGTMLWINTYLLLLIIREYSIRFADKGMVQRRARSIGTILAILSSTIIVAFNGSTVPLLLDEGMYFGARLDTCPISYLQCTKVKYWSSTLRCVVFQAVTLMCLSYVAFLKSIYGTEIDDDNVSRTSSKLSMAAKIKKKAIPIHPMTQFEH